MLVIPSGFKRVFVFLLGGVTRHYLTCRLRLKHFLVLTEATELTFKQTFFFFCSCCFVRLLVMLFELGAAGRLTVPAVDLSVKKREKPSERPCGYWKLLRLQNQRRLRLNEQPLASFPCFLFFYLFFPLLPCVCMHVRATGHTCALCTFMWLCSRRSRCCRDSRHALAINI